MEVNTRYTNAVKHVASCIGKDELLEKLVSATTRVSTGTKVLRQSSLFNMNKQQTSQDIALFTSMKLIVDHSILPTRCQDAGMCEMLNCKSTGHTTLIDTLVQVSFCIDEAIAAEMALKKVQSSMMDGQSPQVISWV